VTGSCDRVDIGAVVTDDHLLDFLILYESLAECWASGPFTLHAFAPDDEVAGRLAGIGVEQLEVHRLPGAGKLDLVEHSGLERCIVSDADNVFLAETPELSLMLADHDLVLVRSNLWSFRSTELARTWARSADPWDGEDLGAAVRVLAPGPYGVEAGDERLSITRDWLGFREERAGRIKVVHLGGLGGEGRRSLEERIDVLVDRFPRIAPLMPFYLMLAERAAERIGVETLPNPMAHAQDRLLDAGMLPTRNELPQLLNRRGLDGTGVEVGVKRGLFSELLLRRWHGRRLVSVDPWLEAPPDEYVDGANVTQTRHEQFYAETVKRLEKFGDRSEIWRTTSAAGAARVEPGTLDFVYLDARHDYRSVKEDLEHWFEKIRAGGVFAGHDYVDELSPDGSYAVKSAVDEFFGARGLPVNPTYIDPGTRAGPPPSWVVEIPA
jgi:Methyltransferase domain